MALGVHPNRVTRRPRVVTEPEVDDDFAGHVAEVLTETPDPLTDLAQITARLRKRYSRATVRSSDRGSLVVYRDGG
jgi:hypothetical protein